MNNVPEPDIILLSSYKKRNFKCPECIKDLCNIIIPVAIVAGVIILIIVIII